MRAKLIVLLLSGLAVVVFGIRNLPWHLDDYDQAKQAYAAVDVVENGSILIQQLPLGGVATKPPLMAWLQAGTYYLTAGHWPMAWRLPSFVAAVILLVLIGRWGWSQWGVYGCCLGIAAFSFNMLSIRIATLVRTDMLLALFCFIPGLMILEHVADGGHPWTRRNKVWFGVAVLAALAMKGPMLCAVLLPGVCLFWLVTASRKQRNTAWPGWAAFLVPLFILLVAVGWAVLKSPVYYEEIIVGEVFSLFKSGMHESHRQPFVYYILHLFHKWSPWSLLLVALAVSQARTLRRIWRDDSVFVLLVCWMAGGLLVMSLVPQKRVDRIYPMVPVLCLLLVSLASHYRAKRLFGVKFKTMLACIIGVGVFGWSLYAVVEVLSNYDNKVDRIKQFARTIEPVNEKGVVVTDSAAEGFMCYVRGSICLSDEKAVAVWAMGGTERLILSRASYDGLQEQLQNASLSGAISDPFNDTEYLLLERVTSE